MKVKIFDKVLSKTAELEYIDFLCERVKIAYPQYISGQPVHPFTYERYFDEVEPIKIMTEAEKLKIELAEVVLEIRKCEEKIINYENQLKNSKDFLANSERFSILDKQKRELIDQINKLEKEQENDKL